MEQKSSICEFKFIWRNEFGYLFQWWLRLKCFLSDEGYINLWLQKKAVKGLVSKVTTAVNSTLLQVMSTSKEGDTCKLWEAIERMTSR